MMFTVVNQVLLAGVSNVTLNYMYLRLVKCSYGELHSRQGIL